MARLQVAEARLGAVCMVARVRPLVTALLPASVTRSRESELGSSNSVSRTEYAMVWWTHNRGSREINA